MNASANDLSTQHPLQNAMETALERKLEGLESGRLHVYPYYGEAYAEVLLPGADPDFNFIFHWGPRLTAYERTLIHTLVYIARKQAGHSAMQTALTGQPSDVPVELYIESVPERIKQQSREVNQLLPKSLTELTNLSASTLYRTLDSDHVKHFVHVEKGKRIHINGRVITAPARFFVRVDPVPTPEQSEQLRYRVAQKMLEDELGLLTASTDRSVTSSAERSLISQTDRSVTSPTEASVSSLTDRSDEKGLSSLTESSLTSQTDRSGNLTVISQTDRSDFLSTRSVCETAHLESLQNPSNLMVTVTRPDGLPTETKEGYKSQEKLTAWRQKNEELARYSSEMLGDEGSMGYHIHVWHHARKLDQRRKDADDLCIKGIFALLSELSGRRSRTGRNQGAAWTKRTKEWFVQCGVPLPDKIREEDLDPEERAEARAALAHLREEPIPELTKDTPPVNDYLRRAQRMANLASERRPQ